MPFGGKNSVFRKPLGTGKNSVNSRVFGKNSVFRKPLGVGKHSVGHKLDNELKQLDKKINELVKSIDIDMDFDSLRLTADANLQKIGDNFYRNIKREADAIVNNALNEKKRFLHKYRKSGGLIGGINKAIRKQYTIDFNKEFKKLKKRVDGALTKAKKDIDTKLTIAKKNIDATLTKAKKDIDVNLTKAKEDVLNELERTEVNLREGVSAAGNFVENQLHSLGETLSDAEKRLREGKIVDVIWHLAVDQIQNTEDNFAQAMTESTLVSAIATSAASIYGGPAGAAAFASWYTYKQTGDLQAALKAGVIAGATAKGLQKVNMMDTSTDLAIVKKTLSSASIGAAAIAASGGDEEDIIEGFVRGAAYTAAREYYKNMTNEEIEGRAPTKGPIAKPVITDENKHLYTILVDEDGQPIKSAQGNYQIDIRSLPKEHSHVGIAVSDLDTAHSITNENSTFMQTVAKVPYMNDMAYFHDQWAAVSQMVGLEVKYTIVPAIMITATGSDTQIIERATEEVIDDKINE